MPQLQITIDDGPEPVSHALNLMRSTFRLLFHVKSTTATALRAVLDGLVADGHQIVDFAQSS